MNLERLGSCAELTTELAVDAAGSSASMRVLLAWASRVARPGNGTPKILMAIARLATADWVEGTPYVEITGDASTTMLSIFCDHGMGIRERLLPNSRFNVSVDEFTRAVRLAPRLIAPFRAVQRDATLLLTPHEVSDDQREVISIAESSLHEQERKTAPPPRVAETGSAATTTTTTTKQEPPRPKVEPPRASVTQATREPTKETNPPISAAAPKRPPLPPPLPRTDSAPNLSPPPRTNRASSPDFPTANRASSPDFPTAANRPSTPNLRPSAPNLRPSTPNLATGDRPSAPNLATGDRPSAPNLTTGGDRASSPGDRPSIPTSTSPDQSGVHTHPTVRRMVAVRPEALRRGGKDD